MTTPREPGTDEVESELVQAIRIDGRYWLLMIVATTFGEIFGNLISRDFGLGYELGSTLLIGLFVVVLSVAVAFGSHNEKLYWALILSGNVAGTDVADLTTRTLSLGNVYGSLLVLAVLVAILLAWTRSRAKARATPTRLSEVLYWNAILASSTFGTTFGDFLSSDTPLGSGWSSVVLLGVLIVTGLLVRHTRVSRTVCYWIALVVMHPIGATIGNFISKPEGWNLGNRWTSVGLALLFVAIYLGARLVKPRLETAKEN